MRDLSEVILESLLEFIRNHNETSDTVMNFYTHIDAAIKAAKLLPSPLRVEMQQGIYMALMANKFFPFPL